MKTEFKPLIRRAHPRFGPWQKTQLTHPGTLMEKKFRLLPQTATGTVGLRVEVVWYQCQVQWGTCAGGHETERPPHPADLCIGIPTRVPQEPGYPGTVVPGYCVPGYFCFGIPTALSSRHIARKAVKSSIPEHGGCDGCDKLTAPAAKSSNLETCV
eukprot:1505209-Rhodomonas_salina.2